MLIYNIRTPHAASASFTVGVTTTQLGTIVAAEDRSLLVLEMDFEGMGTSSGANELGIYRVGTAGVTGSNALTASPIHASAPAFAGTAFFTYATQPIAGALVFPFGFNTNGQRYFWRCNPNLNNAIVVPGGSVAAASIAVFPISGGGTGVGRLQIAEL
jgi:hypothetical protein